DVLSLYCARAFFGGRGYPFLGAEFCRWTVVRLRQGEPIAAGVNRVASATVASVAGAGALALGMWCFTRV
ncbi:hypothetical protein ACFW9X_33865, partial [Streptomyces sp. NPDC059466]|uniref:hypothetical protein n=1 Tax=Streptomyces sp. NPDC059466 TaxID=3346843 RepID=UPI0036AB0BC0